MTYQLLNLLISLLLLLVGAWVLFFVIKHAVADGIALADKRRIARQQLARIEQITLNTPETITPKRTRSTFRPPVGA